MVSVRSPGFCGVQSDREGRICEHEWFVCNLKFCVYYSFHIVLLTFLLYKSGSLSYSLPSTPVFEAAPRDLLVIYSPSRCSPEGKMLPALISILRLCYGKVSVCVCVRFCAVSAGMCHVFCRNISFPPECRRVSPRVSFTSQEFAAKNQNIFHANTHTCAHTHTSSYISLSGLSVCSTFRIWLNE